MQLEPSEPGGGQGEKKAGGDGGRSRRSLWAMVRTLASALSEMGTRGER